MKKKETLRLLESTAPTYPTLERFDATRRRFVGAVAAVAMTGGLVALIETEALPAADKKGKKKKKKPDKPKPPPPHPPTGGVPRHPNARGDS